MNPPFVTVRIATPLAARMTAGGIPFSGIASNRSMMAAAWSTSACIASRGEVVAHPLNKAAAITKKNGFILIASFIANR
jgi:hypothetical protein